MLWLLIAVSSAQAKNWSGASEFSYLKETGKSDVEAIELKNKATYDLPKVAFNGKFNFISYRDEDRLISEEYFTEEKIDWKFQKAEYFFQLFQWEKDVFRNLEYRLTAGIGIGFNLLSLKKDKLV